MNKETEPDYPRYETPSRKRYSRHNPPPSVFAANARRGGLAKTHLLPRYGGNDNSKELRFLRQWIYDELVKRRARFKALSIDVETAQEVLRLLESKGLANASTKMLQVYIDAKYWRR